MKGGWSRGGVFLHPNAVQIMGKPKLVCGCRRFLSHAFATDVKMGTDDHVPFYPALLNSLAGSLFTSVVLLLLV